MEQVVFRMKIVFTFKKNDLQFIRSTLKDFLNAIILWKPSLLQDCTLASVICVSISLNTAFKTP